MSDQTPAKKQKKLTAIEQANRNYEIVTGRLRGLSYEMLSKTYGVTPRRCRQIVEEYFDTSPTPRLRDQTPVQIADAMLDGFTADIEELVVVSAITQSDSVKVSAIATRAGIRSKIMGLLKELRVLPDDLGAITAEIDAQQTARRILAVLRDHAVPIEVQRAMREALMDGNIVDGEAVEESRGELEAAE